MNSEKFKDLNILVTGAGEVPIAEKIQKNLMLFTTNQKDEIEIQTQLNALEETLKAFQ